MRSGCSHGHNLLQLTSHLLRKGSPWNVPETKSGKNTSSWSNASTVVHICRMYKPSGIPFAHRRCRCMYGYAMAFSWPLAFGTPLVVHLQVRVSGGGEHQPYMFHSFTSNQNNLCVHIYLFNYMNGFTIAYAFQLFTRKGRISVLMDGPSYYQI